MLRATKVRIYPTLEQVEYLNAQFGAVRFAYNKALHIKKHAYKHRGVSLNPRKELKPFLAVAKKSRKYAWLKEYLITHIVQLASTGCMASEVLSMPLPRSAVSVLPGHNAG